jgi:hypothetical protein
LLSILIGEAVFVDDGVDLLDDCVFDEVARLLDEHDRLYISCHAQSAPDHFQDSRQSRFRGN